MYNRDIMKVYRLAANYTAESQFEKKRRVL
jgi:hypothetical protein